VDDVYRIEIPTPFDVGRVNCYVFTGAELTLMDPGPATDAAYDRLAAGLDDRGFAVGDVDRVLVTHPHTDHFGLASRVVRESGARTVAHPDATRRLTDPAGYADLERAFFEPFLRTMGVPEGTVDRTLAHSASVADDLDPVAVDRTVTEGDRVDVGVDLRVLHTPGHAPGSVCFLQTTDDAAFTGDLVLPHVFPNPLLTIAPGTTDERTRSLPNQVDSLHRLCEADVEVAHVGHGETIHDLNDRIRETLDHHRRRTERVADLLAESGPTTAYDIMRELFPDLPATAVVHGMSEAIGHLDLLADDGRIDVTNVDDVRRYALA
jgi:glyoxylase-like metal-dependent hydrolase (beta-lactamase superfamily II)